MEISVHLLAGVVLLLLPANSYQQLREPLDTIHFQQHIRSSALVPFTFPSQSTAGAQPPSLVEPQLFQQSAGSPAASTSSDGQPALKVAAPAFDAPLEKSRNSSAADGQGTFSIPKAMLSLTLGMGRCKGGVDTNCATNTVFSPFSISSTLSMLLMGTRGNSYQQLRSALGYHKDADDNDINVAYRFIMERVKRLDFEAGSSILLSVANGLFSQKQSRFSEAYIRNAVDFYQSEIRELDMVLNPLGSVNSINRWVSDKTKGKITNILTSLPPDTQMVVANAVYFNANWADPFAPDLTRREEFFISPNDVIAPLTMRTHSLVAYTESEELGCKMIGIPYKGEDLGMFIVLPTEKDGLNSLIRLEDSMTVDIMEQLFARMESKTVSIALPKFRIQQKLQLKNALRGLGVTDLFSPSSADLSRMTSKTGIALDDIIHQTFIEVTESGTEAAAATVLNLSRDGPSKSFIANQPFLFFIRDMHSKAILFFGRVVRPGEAARTF